MDTPLSSYIIRAEELSQMEETEETKNELNNMVFMLESALKQVKKNQNKASTQLTYNAYTNEYCCKIDDMELHGNLATIYDKKILKNNDILAHQIVACRYGNKCKKILEQKYCKFYHESQDLAILYQAGIISAAYYDEAKQRTRNFASTAWLYHPENPNMRLFGSKSTLIHDLKMLKVRFTRNEEIRTFKAQIMHDLLVLRAIYDSDIQ